MTLPALALAAPAPPPAMQALRWHHRILLVFADGSGDAPLAEQTRLLAPQTAALRERDVLVVRIVGGAVDGLDAGAAAMRAAYRAPAGRFAVRLIGKDGHVAVTRDRPIPPAALFATIDAMPMRRDEMRR